jgi:hypothetical protein
MLFIWRNQISWPVEGVKQDNIKKRRPRAKAAEMEGIKRGWRAVNTISSNIRNLVYFFRLSHLFAVRERKKSGGRGINSNPSPWCSTLSFSPFMKDKGRKSFARARRVCKSITPDMEFNLKASNTISVLAHEIRFGVEDGQAEQQAMCINECTLTYDGNKLHSAMSM